MKKIYVIVLCLFVCEVVSAQKNKHEVYHIPGHEQVEESIGYSHAIKVGKTLYISGTVDGIHDDMASQINTIYQYVEETLKNYGATSANIVKENIFTTNLDEFKENMMARKEFYDDGSFPTSTWVQVERLFIPKLKVEIEFVAVLN